MIGQSDSERTVPTTPGCPTKPDQARPSPAARPSPTKPGCPTKPDQARPSRRPSPTKPDQARPSPTKPGDQARPSPTKPAKPGDQARPSQATKPDQARPSQATKPGCPTKPDQPANREHLPGTNLPPPLLPPALRLSCASASVAYVTTRLLIGLRPLTVVRHIRQPK
ncbi:vegetative cell wall protein gp1-like [Penaeus monodon]|uniref:vegetative cell wall protein gp1-like n=1 Tax=Penaeus monodon TaxID=6687 RepID=UPI0018A79856|nr:vegetative cell wall protein gp1-like [Penaeus monodon]